MAKEKHDHRAVFLRRWGCEKFYHSKKSAGQVQPSTEGQWQRWSDSTDKLFGVHVKLNTSEHRGSHPSRQGGPYFKTEYFIFIR